MIVKHISTSFMSVGVSTMIKPGIYQHYKGKFYKVIGIAHHTETLEEVVVYQALYDNHDLWVRPATMFKEMVTVEGIEQPRFKFTEATSL